MFEEKAAEVTQELVLKMMDKYDIRPSGTGEETRQSMNLLSVKHVGELFTVLYSAVHGSMNKPKDSDSTKEI